MIERVLGELYGRAPASFEAAGSPEEAARALSEATPSSFLSARFSPSVVGSISLSRVVLRYYRPFLSNAFAPIFRGHFSVQAGRTVLQGHFALPLITQGFMTLWFGLLAVISFSGLALGPIQAARTGTSLWAGLSAGVSMAVAVGLFGLLGLGFVKLCKRLARSDPERIARHIEQSLGRPPPPASR